MMFQLNVPTKRGVVLNGVLFRSQKERRSDTVMIAITGIHGNFYSNPFYYNIGDTLNSGNIDFIYAQTHNAFSEIPTVNVRTAGKKRSAHGTNAFPIPTTTSTLTLPSPKKKATSTSSSAAILSAPIR